MIRSIRVDAVLVQAVIAGALSFAHLHDLAAAAGQHGWKAWVYPVSVDLLLVAAWRRLRAGGPTRLAWCWFLIALVASLGANIATAGLLDLSDVPDWLRILVAGWPALAFLGGTLLVHTPATADDMEPEPLSAVDHVRAEPEPAPVPVPDAVEPAEPVPALHAAPPADVPPALVDHARKLADSHRASTGTPIDAATLRDRLGLPGPMADQLAAHLT
ncbi:DUF2637 domain-containing protein [Streptomyces wuyuanensis]|uniref:SpdA protein n=1 Tax=Streptomyces wuyuanensis TaxID=1196353 RepID=A0A1H0E5H6_9ACTN|nr:DUF2637 domain-containing protein [Streptomyces wuyuanensis]SDN77629.1 Protein of unknown function [Streptomyces wuyuanensis]